MEISQGLILIEDKGCSQRETHLSGKQMFWGRRKFISLSDQMSLRQDEASANKMMGGCWGVPYFNQDCFVVHVLGPLFKH